jgi:long-chain acyl-CoA synthetase
MLAKAGSVGRPVPGVAVEVVDAAGNPLPEGMVGEIRSRPLWALRRDGDGENPGRGFERIAGGWSYPGDFGYFDAEGFLYLKGRGTEIIRRGAGEVFAAEIEAVLAAHPDVAEAAVIGRPRAGDADEIIAFVVRRGALDHDALAVFCRARLAGDRWPDQIYYMDALPRVSGKVDRVQLLTTLAEGGHRIAQPNAGRS